MNDEEGDRCGAEAPRWQDSLADPDLIFFPELKEKIIDAFAEVLDLTVDEVSLRRMDDLKYWEIAQAELPSLGDVEEALLTVQNQVFRHAMQQGWIKRSQATAFKKLLYCELFPAAEMGDSLCRETRLPVAENI